jgi:prepilin-type N-terminal cleavage/methylation domain-containing protein/prepilin-type processing-associated H-X9-DG protein
MRPRKAFTIVELLVVIGIIAVLISILLPALNRAREQARVVVCASNERQIYLAMCVYASVNRGVLPIPLWVSLPHFPNAAIQIDAPGLYNYTDGALWPYIPGGPDVRQRVFLCPSDGPDRQVILDISAQVDYPGLTRNFTYNFNGHLTGNQVGAPVMTDRGMIPAYVGIKLAQIKGADHKLLVLETNDPRDTWNEIATFDNQGHFLSLLSHRHFGRANQCFADGHVELFDDSVLGPPANQHRRFVVLLPTQGGYQP